jgi:predicted acylesterase/phospholipase RssA/uncharacterized membrane protein
VTASDLAIGIALSAGSASAMAHVGVLEELQAAGIPIRVVSGTSAGAMVGAAFAAERLAGFRDAMCGLTRGRVLRLFDPTLSHGGLFDGRRAMELIRPYVGDEIENLARRYAAVATDLHSGERVVLREGSVLEAVRASIAIPGLFTPRRRGERWLVDGGLVDPIPVGVARRLGAEFVIASNVLPLGQLGHDRMLSQPQDSEPRMVDVILSVSRVVESQLATARLHEHPSDWLLQISVPELGIFGRCPRCDWHWMPRFPFAAACAAGPVASRRRRRTGWPGPSSPRPLQGERRSADELGHRAAPGGGTPGAARTCRRNHGPHRRPQRAGSRPARGAPAPDSGADPPCGPARARGERPLRRRRAGPLPPRRHSGRVAPRMAAIPRPLRRHTLPHGPAPVTAPAPPPPPHLPYGSSGEQAGTVLANRVGVATAGRMTVRGWMRFSSSSRFYEDDESPLLLQAGQGQGGLRAAQTIRPAWEPVARRGKGMKMEAGFRAVWRRLAHAPCHPPLYLSAALTVLALGFPPTAARATATFTRLGPLPGTQATEASGISADGSTVVGVYGSQAVRWTASGAMVSLGTLPGDTHSFAVGVSADGSTITGNSNDSSTSHDEAFVWTAAGGMVGIGPGAGAGGIGVGVSADGSVIVGRTNSSDSSTAFRWTASGGMVGLGGLPGTYYAEATGVSADGSTVVGWTRDLNGYLYEAFRWTASEGMVGLPGGSNSAGVSSSLAYGISADGSTIVGSALDSAGVDEAARWTASSGWVGLGNLPGTTSATAYAVSADGSVIVGNSYDSASSSTKPFIWDATHGMRDLAQVLSAQGADLSGWDLQNATGISADGRSIVGNGLDSFGVQQGWIAVLPEPGTDALLLAALLGLAVVRRRGTPGPRFSRE